MDYKIRSFDAVRGQITVEFAGFALFSIDLVPDEQGLFPTGPALNAYIMGFLPVAEIERREKVAAASNAADIASLVEPVPPPVEPDPVEPIPVTEL
jgi:hypothetical protein